MLNHNRITRAKDDIYDAYLKIKELTSIPYEEFSKDYKNALALRQLILQTAEGIAIICQHILAKDFAKPVTGYSECITRSQEVGLISRKLSDKLDDLISLRNLIVHRYWKIDDEKLYTHAINDVEDLLMFLKEIDGYILKMDNKSY